MWKGALVVVLIASTLAAEPSTGHAIVAAPETVEGATLQGIVRDERGPVAGATVKVTAESLPLLRAPGESAFARETCTAADGRFALGGLRPDRWHDVTVEADGHASGGGGGWPSETVFVDVVLRSCGSIRGSVVGDATEAFVRCEGRPAPGSELGPKASVEDGRFTIDPALPGTYRCFVEGALASAMLENVVVRAGAATEVQARMKDLPSIIMEVRDAVDGRAVEGAEVSVGAREGRTGADGRARVAFREEGDMDLPPEMAPLEEWLRERMREVRISAFGYENAQVFLPRPAPPVTVVSLQPVPVFRGRVENIAGAPVPGAAITWQDLANGVVADPKGRFAIPLPLNEDLALGALTLSAIHRQDGAVDSGLAEVTFADRTDTDIVIRLDEHVEAAELTCIVTDGSKSVEGVHVLIAGEDMVEAVTNGEGRVHGASLTPGWYTVSLEVDDGALLTRQVELEPGAHVTQEIRLGEGWRTSGRVIRSGRPAEGVLLSWSGTDGRVGGLVRSRADGSFEIGPVHPETEEIRAVPAYESVQPEWVVRRGAPSVTIELGTTRVTGRLFADDLSAGSTSVWAQCPGVPRRAPQDIASDGGFVLKDVPADSTCTLIQENSHGTSLVQPFRSPIEGTLDLGDVVVPVSRHAGRARFPEGSTARSLRFELRDGTGMQHAFRDTSLGGGGSFELALPSGPFDGFVRPDDPSIPWLAVSVDDRAPLDLRFEEGGSIEVVAGGSSEKRLQVREAGGWSHDDFAFAEVGWPSPSFQGGRAILSGLPSGKVRIAVVDDVSFESIELVVDVHSGETTHVVVPAP